MNHSVQVLTAQRVATRGFTLLELSIVLIIIALVTGMAVTSGISVIATARQVATQNKMAAIDKAMLAFRTANNRLPCPGDLTITPGSANYGVEGANQGTCVGGTPSANFWNASSPCTVEGGVPAATLGLSPDFMYDGWGNRLRYAVDISTTTTNAFLSLPLTYNGTITVNDGNGNARSGKTVYVVVSHGANGHGAYTTSGATINTGSDNPNELINCHCSGTTGASTNYPATGYAAPTYVQQPFYNSPTDSLNTFDDMVSYKERWQLQTPWDTNPPSATTTMASAAGSIQAVEGGQVWIGAGWSPNNVLDYTYNPATNGFINVFPNAGSVTPGSNMGFGSFSFSWSWDDRYLAVYDYSSPGLAIYKRSGANLTEIYSIPYSGTGSTMPGITGSDTITGVWWSHDGTLLEVGGTIASASSYNGPYLASINESTDTFTQIPPASLPNAGVYPWISNGPFTVDDNYIAGAWEAPAFYHRTGSTSFATVAPTTVFPTDPGVGWLGRGAFSNDGQYYAIMLNNQTQIEIFKNAGSDVFNPYQAVTISPSGGSNSQTPPIWSPDGNWIEWETGWPSFSAYILHRCGNSFVQFGAPMSGYNSSWSADSQFFATYNSGNRVYHVSPSGFTSATITNNAAYGWGGEYYWVFRNTNNP